MKSKIYISGRITGITIKEATDNFYEAEKDLFELDYEVINPMTIKHDHDKSWKNYMKNDIKELLNCSHIYMLKGWHLSKGANIEFNLAKDLGLTIYFQ